MGERLPTRRVNRRIAGVLSVLLWPVEAWGLMLTLGILRADVFPGMKAVGYGRTVFALTVTIPLITLTVATSTRLAIQRGPEVRDPVR